LFCQLNRQTLYSACAQERTFIQDRLRIQENSVLSGFAGLKYLAVFFKIGRKPVHCQVDLHRAIYGIQAQAAYGDRAVLFAIVVNVIQIGRSASCMTRRFNRGEDFTAASNAVLVF